MDDSETYMNVKFTKTDAQSLSPAEPDVSYAELNVKTLSAPRVRTDGDCLNCTYSELNFRKEEPCIDEDEDPPIASGPGGLPTTAQTEQTCPQDWIDNEDRCYLISRLENSYDGAREHCSKFDARLLEINSNVERDFVSSSFDSEYRYHWIENCGDGHTMDPPPALSATRTHRATVVKGNRDSSARSLHIYTQIFLKRSKVSVNTPWDRLQSNDNTPLHPIQSTPLSPPHPFIPSQPLCPNTYPILLLYSHPHSPPLLPLPPSELLFFPLGPALPISATHIYSPFPTLFTLCPSNPQLIPLLFFPLLHGPHFLPPLSGSLHQLSLQFCTHWPSVHQQRGKVCAHSPCLCLSWLHTYAPRNKAPSFMPSLHNSDPRVPATSS
ncbi:uncharacterized protein [Mobula birostris]|uniref:uncharacterized protein isoform X3 n=1 Tax=Mobula birostris TaxID=1983395 RepID=UPI003B28958D